LNPSFFTDGYNAGRKYINEIVRLELNQIRYQNTSA
jgi:hypothetical protein